MGIQDLKAHIKKRYPHIIKRINIIEFSGNKICVDLSTYLYKYKVAYQNYWKNPFIHLICTFKRYNIHAQFIKDGQAPPEKDREHKKRKDSKDQLETQVFNVSLHLENFKTNGVVTDLLTSVMQKISKSDKNVEKISRLFKVKKFGDNKVEQVEEKQEVHINIEAIENYINKKEGQIVNITPEDHEDLKGIFQKFGVPLIQASGEAEALGSYKCRFGDCAAILTEDTDVLTYNAPIFLSDFDTSTGFCDAIYIDDVLENFGFTHDEFVDFCILCGCDYNPRIPNKGIVAAHSIITKYRSIDKFIEDEEKKENPCDYKILNHVRSRELFKTYGGLTTKFSSSKILDKYKSLYWETLIDLDDLFHFLSSKKCRYSAENIREYWKPPDIVFEDSPIPEDTSEGSGLRQEIDDTKDSPIVEEDEELSFASSSSSEELSFAESSCNED